MSFEKEYKRFRRYLRRFELVPSLLDVCRYSLHVMEGEPLPAEYAADMPRPMAGLGMPEPKVADRVYPWELDTLARELVLHAGSIEHRSLKNWHHFAEAINRVRRLEGSAYSAGDPEGAEVLLEIHRVGHRQFPWQQANIGLGPFARALKVFGQTPIDAIVMRELGMTSRQLLQLGMAVGGTIKGFSRPSGHGCDVVKRIAHDVQQSNGHADQPLEPIQQCRRLGDALR